MSQPFDEIRMVERPSGVRPLEEVTFRFGAGYPVLAPEIRLRADFNRSHPHIQPGDALRAGWDTLAFSPSSDQTRLTIALHPAFGWANGMTRPVADERCDSVPRRRIGEAVDRRVDGPSRN